MRMCVCEIVFVDQHDFMNMCVPTSVCVGVCLFGRAFVRAFLRV